MQNADAEVRGIGARVERGIKFHVESRDCVSCSLADTRLLDPRVLVLASSARARRLLVACARSRARFRETPEDVPEDEACSHAGEAPEHREAVAKSGG